MLLILRNSGTLKMRDMNLRDMHLRHQLARVEIARHENARNAIVLLHMSVLCPSGMHE